MEGSVRGVGRDSFVRLGAIVIYRFNCFPEGAGGSAMVEVWINSVQRLCLRTFISV